jgi:aromatic-L-amino-acid/L-tryptophan decarboxylase
MCPVIPTAQNTGSQERTINVETTSSWEWSAEEIRQFGYNVVDEIAQYLTRLSAGPVFQPFPASLAGVYLNEPAPANGSSPDEILETFKRDIEPYPFGNGHPRFYGWVNSPPTVIGIFADALAATMNPSCAGGNHAAIYVERQVVNWFKQIIGFPPDSMGLLVSGSSMAALTALAVARHARCGFDVRTKGLQSSPHRLVFYKTAEGHGCHQKAIELLGIGSDNLRIIPHDAAFKMIPAELENALDRDVSQGDVPAAVIATAGTVNTGAIDPVQEIADICRRRNVWLHIDGAYGAPAILSKKYEQALSALGYADSLALDPHKWLYVPVEAGLVLIRHAELMRSAFSLVPPYLRTDGNTSGVGGLPWFSEYGFQQTRSFRALKVWMALKHQGLTGYRYAINADIKLAEHLANTISSLSDFELCKPQSLSIVCFRYAPPKIAQNPNALDELNKKILEKIQLGGRAFLSSTVLNGKFWLRACIVNPHAHLAQMDELVELVREAGTQCAN